MKVAIKEELSLTDRRRSPILHIFGFEVKGEANHRPLVLRMGHPLARKLLQRTAELIAKISTSALRKFITNFIDYSTDIRQTERANRPLGKRPSN